MAAGVLTEERQRPGRLRTLLSLRARLTWRQYTGERGRIVAVILILIALGIVAFGVLLDTFLVRSVLVPAIVLKLGDRFWWPSALGRAAPEREPAGTERSA